MALKEQQLPITVQAQIENLKSLKLIVEDEIEAKEFLEEVAYFRFIKAYSLGLKQKNSDYSNQVSFNQLKELYRFNTKFRTLLFAEIEHIEVGLRCKVSNYFSLTHGVLGYEDANNFLDREHHSRVIEEINRDIEHNKRAPFIKNFRENYENGDIPFYALVEVLSFGTLSKFFKNMKGEDKKEISKMYGVGYTFLESWIESISHVRNICAHYGRLYNAKLSKTPMLYKEDKYNTNRIFAVLCCMKRINNNSQRWNTFVDEVSDLISAHPHVVKETMGFPENWEKVLKFVNK